MSRFDEIAEPFQMMEQDMRLELLLEYSEKLPPLPERFQELRDAGLNMVHECQSPVFLMTEVESGGADDKRTIRVHADVPKSAPTARAFVSILHDAFDGATPEDVRTAPDDALRRLGLDGMLGMQRTQGLSAIYQRLKHDVQRRMEGGEAGNGGGA